MTSTPTSGEQHEPENTAREPVRMCERWFVTTKNLVKVREIHSGSGPGWSVYVCTECAPRYPVQRDPIAMLDEIDRFRRAQGNADS